MVNKEKYTELVNELSSQGVTLVAVSKIKSKEDILSLYNLGQRDFGENYVQELVDKEAALPKDIRWHFIGHLQSNKVKYIAPFVHLIQGVDSFKLLKEINKQAAKCNRIIECLLQVHIAQEETKFGMNETELEEVRENIAEFNHVKIRGLMGMASFSDDKEKIKNELGSLKKIFNRPWSAEWSVLSMGMSGDYQMAIQEGSTMVRVGSLLFGARG